jgi:predicted RNA-binding Zn ribbon-like protein
LALNFVATVRHRGSQPRDLLKTPETLSKWFLLAGLTASPVQVSSSDHREALHFREAIHDTLCSLILKREVNADHIDLLNKAARYPLPVPQLDGSHCITWDTGQPVKACIAMIARDAITAIGDSERRRLKMCDNGSCRMLFIDVSPANSRRWCAMSICGNRKKVALHRKRKAECGPAENQPDESRK